MKKSFALTLLLMFPLLAYAQKVVHQECERIVGDSTSIFYGDRVAEIPSQLLRGEYVYPLTRVITNEGDTMVCQVHVLLGRPGDKRELAIAWLSVEDCSLSRQGYREPLSGETRTYKIKWHMRMKVKAYKSYYSTAAKPMIKRVTAYIDYFPCDESMNVVRFKVKRMRYRTGDKYGVYKSPESSHKFAAKHAEADRKQKEAFRRKVAKDREWGYKYCVKYRPDLLHYYKKQESKK